MKKKIKKILCMIIACSIIILQVLPAYAIEPFEQIGNVKISDKAYSMMISDTGNSFLRNDKPVDMKVGKRFYLTYTVDKVNKNILSQNGLIIAPNGEDEWPYEKGMMKYDFDGNFLLEEGATYFYRVEVTENGFSYVIAKKSANDSEWIELPEEIGDNNKNCKYFGIWFAGVMNTKLSAVMCYDEDGNDLGVHLQSLSGNTVVYTSDVFATKEVGQYYEFALNGEPNIAISNKTSTDSNVVYMTYRVENVKNNSASQAGVAYSNNPKGQYPHSEGILNYELCEKSSPLFVEGANYVVRAQKDNGELKVLVKRTLNGKDEVFSFASKDGEYRNNAGYFSLWIGEGVEHSVTADIKEFRCYDKDGNNLGVQINKDNIVITKYGDLEDYSQCEAVYWCKDINKQIVLEDTQKITVKDCNDESSKIAGTYTVNGTKLTMKNGKSSEVFTYYYGYMLDNDGNRYNRLKDTKITFVAGSKSDSGTWTIDVKASDGYKAKKPAEPKVDGDKFKCWCRADGSEFDFDEYVTESVTLYAKYENGDGNEYVVLDIENEEVSDTNYVIPAICIGMILLTLFIVIFMYRRSKRHD